MLEKVSNRLNFSSRNFNRQHRCWWRIFQPWSLIVTNFESPTPRFYQHNCSQIPLQSVQIFDVDHVINRKMMKSVRRWMNRNFVFFENFGFTLFGYRWFASRLQFDFQKLYKNFKIFQFCSKTTISCPRAPSPEYFTTTIHSSTTFHRHLIFTVRTAMELESWKLKTLVMTSWWQ